MSFNSPVDGIEIDPRFKPKISEWSQGVIAATGWHGSWLALFDAYSRLGIDTSAADGLSETTKNAHWWWALSEAAVISERPLEINRDAQGRLHNANGPAILYKDGFAIYSWHGTSVPSDMIETNWSTQRIFEEENTEVRRAAIERMGWDEFIKASGMQAVGPSVPDPGNAPHELTLYDLPEEIADIFEEDARVLLCTNGTVERDGTRKRYGLIVPAHHSDPVAAAADLYGWPVEAYRTLQARR